MHLAVHGDLLFADYWNVVFRLTGNRARVAADAHVEVHDHPPLVAFVEVFLRVIERFFDRRMFLFLLREVRIRHEFFERAVVENPARTVDVVMLLSAYKQMPRAGLANC